MFNPRTRIYYNSNKVLINFNNIFLYWLVTLFSSIKDTILILKNRRSNNWMIPLRINTLFSFTGVLRVERHIFFANKFILQYYKFLKSI